MRVTRFDPEESDVKKDSYPQTYAKQNISNF